MKNYLSYLSCIRWFLLFFINNLAFTNNQKPIYIGFYTINTPYQEEVCCLIDSLEKFKLDHDIQGISSLGSWQKNTQFKAVFIQEMQQKYPNRPLVYLDADAEVKIYPILFDQIEADVAVHYYSNPRKESAELLSGTIFLGTSENARKLVKEWICTNQKFPDQWDQKNLALTINHMPELKVYHLPASYTLIFDLMKDLGPAVIEHHQASRRYKKKVDQ